jgi:O-acetylhomoserine (thiol)-lyase
VTRTVDIGRAKPLATHQDSTTHRLPAPAELAAAGLSEDIVRLSIGIEHVDDLIEELERAQRASRRRAPGRARLHAQR